MSCVVKQGMTPRRGQLGSAVAEVPALQERPLLGWIRHHLGKPAQQGTEATSPDPGAQKHCLRVSPQARAEAQSLAMAAGLQQGAQSQVPWGPLQQQQQQQLQQA